MDTFHFSTVFMAILTSNIMLIIIAVIIRNEKILLNAGYKLITIFLMLTAVRFLLPFEVPFTTTFPLPQGISNIIIEFFSPRFTIGSFDISIFKIVILIWVIGIVFYVYQFIKTDYMIRMFIFTFGRKVNKDTRYAAIMNEIYEGNRFHRRFQIFEVPDIQTPFLYGFATPYILMPVDFQCTDKELAYILRHEALHYKHHDLWIKFGIQLISIVYWWNPFGHMLNKQLNLVLEMRIDDNVTGTDQKDIFDYMNCLFSVAEYQDTIFNSKFANVISFSLKDKPASAKRFLMLSEKQLKKNHVLNFAIIGLIGCIYILSYLLIFEAYVENSTIDVNNIIITEINSFIVDNEDGTYSLYISNIKVETLTSLEYYGDDIPIYTREEYKHVQQEKSK